MPKTEDWNAAAAELSRLWEQLLKVIPQTKYPHLAVAQTIECLTVNFDPKKGDRNA